MKVIFTIWVIYLFMKGVFYKATFYTMSKIMKEKRNIIPTDEEMKECSEFVLKKEWIKILL